MSTIGRSLMAAAVTLLVAAPVGAQEVAGPGGTVAFIGGGAATSSTAGPLFGGTVVYDFNERLSLEGQGAWFGRGSGSEAISLNASLLVNLLPLGGTAVPYAAVGGGMYRASFDLAHTRLLGQIDPGFGPGSEFCPAAGTGYMRGPGAGPGLGTCTSPGAGYWGVGEMPGFYARRLGPIVVPANGVWETRTFTDPALTLGGGVRFTLARHLEIRPDARALIVFDGGNSHTVGIFGVNIGYRF